MKSLQGLFSSFGKAADSIRHPFMVLVAFLSVVVVVLMALLVQFRLTKGHVHPGWILALGVGVIVVFVTMAAALYYTEEQNRHKEQQLQYAERTVGQLKQVLRDVVLELQEGEMEQTVSPRIQITYVECDPPGDDVQGEFVAIENCGEADADLANWVLCDEAGHRFTFPAFTLKSGARARVWTKAGTNTTTDLYWGRDLAIWNNRGDYVSLLDSMGELVHSYRY